MMCCCGYNIKNKSSFESDQLPDLKPFLQCDIIPKGYQCLGDGAFEMLLIDV